MGLITFCVLFCSPWSAARASLNSSFAASRSLSIRAISWWISSIDFPSGAHLGYFRLPIVSSITSYAPQIFCMRSCNRGSLSTLLLCGRSSHCLFATPVTAMGTEDGILTQPRLDKYGLQQRTLTFGLNLGAPPTQLAHTNVTRAFCVMQL